MPYPDEIAQLEAERNRLLSMIAYQSRPMLRASPWLMAVAIGAAIGMGIALVTGLLLIQEALWGRIILIVAMVLSAYILTRKMTWLGITVYVAEVAGLVLSWPHLAGLIGSPPGELEARQRLANCEARIKKLRSDTA